MVTIAIMGIAFVAILTGVAIAISASDSHRQEATAEGIVRSFAERISDPKDTPYVRVRVRPATYQNPSGFELPPPAGARQSRPSRTSSRGSRRRPTAAVVPHPISARSRSRSR